MRFENDSHLEREERAIKKFCSLHNLKCKKLGANDIDFQIWKDNKVIGFVEVKGRHKDISEAYPLPIAIRKIHKLQGEHGPRVNPIIIWACHDGIIYGKLMKLKGDIRLGGRPPRKGAVNDQEIMAYYNKQEALRHEQY